MLVAPTNEPAAQLRTVAHELLYAEGGLTRGRFGKEIRMELLAAMSEWLVWCAAAAAGAIALAALASILDAALELDAS
jgi:hypothetical protein